MDNNINQPENPSELSSVTQSSPSVFRKHIKFFLILGVLILLTISFCAGYYAGIQNKTVVKSQNNAIKPQPTPTPTINQPNEIKESNGMIEFIKRTGPSDEDYKITYPVGWQRETRAFEDYAQSLLLHQRIQGEDGNSKDYTLEISQGPGGVALECVFKAEEEFRKDPVIGQSMGINFKDFNGVLGAFRRSNEVTEVSPEGENEIAVCQLEKRFNNYQNSTQVGMINYILPDGFDPEMLDEIDEIVKTIEVVPKEK